METAIEDIAHQVNRTPLEMLPTNIEKEQIIKKLFPAAYKAPITWYNNNKD